MKILSAVFICVVAVLIFTWWKSSFALPIFCTTRGCVTTVDRSKEKVYQLSFAKAAGSSAPSEAAILTTVVRRHLILKSANNTISKEDAIEYRSTVLHITQEDIIKQMGFTSFQEYDERVTIPFLFQQSYISENSLNDSEEAYVAISKNFRVVSLLFGYTWDSSRGEVVTRD